ncbi:hypothetical protein BHE74_00055596 [Ensete ventricosum]|nr:hypothetical protein GW17_00005306 [Ensete ventricosum]RWW39099.1 hypothetical protein BHE74_00055596 [Ensete ventricosum]RZS00414.1 hypothetical protein BHM03_00030111 [Ensete ventricosum]
MSFLSYLKWMCIDQSNVGHAMVSWSFFLLLNVFFLTTNHFVLSCAPTCSAYDVMIHLSLISVFGLSYLYLSAFVCRCNLYCFFFLDKFFFCFLIS